MQYIKLFEDWEAPEEWESPDQEDLSASGIDQDLNTWIHNRLKNDPTNWKDDGYFFDLFEINAVVKFWVSDLVVKPPPTLTWLGTTWEVSPVQGENAISLYNLDYVGKDPSYPKFRILIIAKYHKPLAPGETDPDARFAYWQKLYDQIPSANQFKEDLTQFNQWASSPKLRTKNKKAPNDWT